MSADDTTVHVSVLDNETEETITHFHATCAPQSGDTIDHDPLYGKPRVRGFVVRRTFCTSSDRLQDVVVYVKVFEDEESER